MTRFTDLRDGGDQLSASLGQWRHAAGAVVLGIARGGMPAACAVATALRLPLDVLLLQRLCVCPTGPPDSAPATPPGSRTDTACAFRVAGAEVIDAAALAHSTAPGQAANMVEALARLAARERICRGPLPALDVTDRVVLLVDNGVRTGGTIRGAVRALRTLRAGRIVVAVPTGDAAGVAGLRTLVDDVVCLTTPSPFGHVGMWYRRFDVPSDDAIGAILRLRTAGRARVASATGATGAIGRAGQDG